MSRKVGILLVLAATILGIVSNQELKIIIKNTLSANHSTRTR